MSTPSNLNYEFGPFLLEPHARRLSRDGVAVPLAAPEFEILLLLLRNRGRVVEKSELMEAVWPDAAVEENNLTVRMSSLRRSLGETKGDHQFIQTVTGRGYCLIAQVRELLAQPGTQTPEAISNTQTLPESAVPHSVGVEQRSSSTSAKWSIKGFRLYALLLVGLLAAASLYLVLRRQKERGPEQSMKLSRVTHTGRVTWAAVSPDGRNVAYGEREGELSSLWLQRAGTNNPLQLLPPAKLVYRDPAFSPDGNTLYYSKCEPGCRLQTIPVYGGLETALPIRADCPVTFSPDGKRMAYVRVDAVEMKTVVNLLVANADGTGEETLNSRVGGLAYQRGAPSWSPDGKIIAFPLLESEGEKRYMRVIGVNVADRSESTLTGQRWRFINDVAWLRSGDGFIISGRDEGSAPETAMQIWRISYPGGEARRITNDLNNYTRVSISADGSTLMALEMHWTNGLWIAPAENLPAAVQVTRGTIDRRDGHLGLSIAPDGRIIYVSDLNGKRDLWSITPDGTHQKQLTDGPHRDGEPVVTPDGRYIVFESSREGANSIWRVDADGRNPIRLTRGSLDVEPTCSPDGKWIVYVSNDGLPPKLRRVSIDGGEPIPLTEEFSQHPTFSPDGKLIAYYRMDMQNRQRRDIVIIPAEGGPPVKTMPAPKNFGSIMRWAPAGNALTYRENTLTALWRMPLDGSESTALTTLRGESLFTFSYSPDGRHVAYSRGPRLTDAILITGFE